MLRYRNMKGYDLLQPPTVILTRSWKRISEKMKSRRERKSGKKGDGSNWNHRGKQGVTVRKAKNNRTCAR